MIFEASTLVATGLNQYIHAEDGSPIGTADVAILGNPSHIDDQTHGAALENRVLISVLNLEEETTLKNGPTAFSANGSVETRNRPIYLNLFLLISANYTDYGTALTRIGQVMTFFQAQKKFDTNSFPNALPTLAPGLEISVSMELISLNLEEISFVWGSYGAHGLPFAAYRARLVVLDARRPALGGGEVLDIPVHMHDRFAGSSGGR